MAAQPVPRCPRRAARRAPEKTPPLPAPAPAGVRRAALALGLCALGPAALAWGDRGHQVVGEIASRFLQPAARHRAYALLAADDDPLTARGLPPGSLHGDWDTQLVQRLDPRADALAARLAARITPAQRQQWSQGTPAGWARETSELSRGAVYGPPPAPDAGGMRHLPPAYAARSGPVVEARLSKAGVRLAALLDRQLGTP